MYIIVNSKGERMYQYPATTHRDTALKLLAAARVQYPEAGMKLEYRNEQNLEKTERQSVMKRWYFTFGCGIDDHHRNCYTVIEAESYESAREEMVRRFGVKWAFQYSEEEWTIDPKKDEDFHFKARLYGFDPNLNEPITQAELYNLTRI